jgi:hypothetical protein
MSIEAVFQPIEALAVVIGVGFAIIQIRQYRRDKRREAAMELLHSFLTPQFAKALNIVYILPDGLSKDEIESQDYWVLFFYPTNNHVARNRA